jgi:hypothetical protein
MSVHSHHLTWTTSISKDAKQQAAEAEEEKVHSCLIINNLEIAIQGIQQENE